MAAADALLDPDDAARSPLLLTVKQTCAALSIGRTMLHELVTTGDLPVVRIGRAVRFRADDVRALVADRAERQQPRQRRSPKSG